jgi:riboflavin kinase / FMN adenylyltransferase
MWIEHDIKSLDLMQGSGVTIGAFDGVHRGHQALIGRMVAGSHAAGHIPVVVTFDPLPGQVLHPETYQLLSALDERLDRMATQGVEGAVILPFDEAFMATSAKDFADILVDHLKMQGLWAGPDFALGRAREGTIAFLRNMGAARGFDVHIFKETIRWQGKPVRSSRIRAALRRGDVGEANGCLGYPYELRGSVVRGDQRGRTMGFPTANLDVPDQRLLPANGVYICDAHLCGSDHIGEHYAAITNIGTRPTFDNGERTVEAYLLDFSSDIYDVEMRLSFLHRLRPELRFNSIEALIAQMNQDKAATRRWLHTWQAVAPQASCAIEHTGPD